MQDSILKTCSHSALDTQPTPLASLPVSPRIALYLLHVLLPVASVAGLVVVLQVAWGVALHGPGVITLLCGVVVVYTAERLLERHAELGRLLVRWLLTLGAIAALIAG
jgi:hypothetical protein